MAKVRRLAVATGLLLLLVFVGIGAYQRLTRGQRVVPGPGRGLAREASEPERRRPVVAPVDPAAPRAALRIDVGTEPPLRPCTWTLSVRVRDGDAVIRKGAGVGAVELGGLAPTRALVTISAPGFLDDRQSIDLPSGGAAELEVTLRALATLAGRVDGPEGPIEGAHVFAAISARERGRLGFVGADNMARLEPARTTTDAAGEFEFADVVPSEGYVVDVRHQDYGPVVLDPVVVAAGASEELAVRLLPGSFLTGRILDHRGRPFGKVLLDVLVPDPKQRNAWLEDSTVRIKEDGSFRTAPLTAETLVLLRASTTRDGVHVPFIHRTGPIPPGPTDLGVIQIRSHVVTFRLPRDVEPEGLSFLAAGERDRATGQFGALTATLSFDADGELRVAGLSPGRVSYSVWRPGSGGGPVAEGTYVDDGTERVVQLTAAPRDPPAGSVRVKAAVRAGATAFVLLVKDGSITFGGPVPASAPFEAGGYVGDYTVHLVEGDEVGSARATITDRGMVEVDVSATSVGGEAHLTVVEAGEPVTGARIGVYGFVESARSYSYSWGKTDETGRVTLRGLPPGVAGLKIAVTSPAGDGRLYFVPAAKFGGATLDLQESRVR